MTVGKSQAELTQLVDEALRTQPGCETARVAAVRALPGYVINSSSCCAVPLFVPRTVPSSRPARGARITLDRTPSHRF